MRKIPKIEFVDVVFISLVVAEIIVFASIYVITTHFSWFLFLALMSWIPLYLLVCFLAQLDKKQKIGYSNEIQIRKIIFFSCTFLGICLGLVLRAIWDLLFV